MGDLRSCEYSGFHVHDVGVCIQVCFVGGSGWMCVGRVSGAPPFLI